MITLVQTDIAYAQTEQNLQTAERALLGAPHSDLYVLPEMWNSGFMAEPDVRSGDISLQWMTRMARELDAAVAGSMATKEGDVFVNRLYFVKPDGTVSWYDKRHLFTLGGEHLHYSAGEESTVVEWRGVRYLLQICYDLRFPSFARNAYDDTCPSHALYDCILYVASWPSSRRTAWDTLLRARAIENQCYVCGVNRIGEDPACRYSGGTVVIDPYGNELASCADNEQTTVTASLDMEALVLFREKFPVLKDADEGRNA